MGIAIHYRGKLENPHLLPELLLAARHFAFKRQWRYADVDERIIGVVDRATAEHTTVENETAAIDDTLRGIIIHPHPDCGPVWLTFNQDGLMCFFMPQLRTGHYVEIRDLLTQTHFAPVDIHISICELFHLIQDRFFPGIEVADEGEYYLTGDPARLAQLRAEQETASEGTLSSPEQSPATGASDKDADGSARRRFELAPRQTLALARPGWKRGYGISAHRN